MLWVNSRIKGLFNIYLVEKSMRWFGLACMNFISEVWSVSQCFFLGYPKSVHGKNAKFTVFVIKRGLFYWCMWNFPRRLVSLCETESIIFQKHFTNRNPIISVFLFVSIEWVHWPFLDFKHAAVLTNTWSFKTCRQKHF